VGQGEWSGEEEELTSAVRNVEPLARSLEMRGKVLTASPRASTTT